MCNSTVHGASLAPSLWVGRFAAGLKPATALDLAAGGGRHTRLLLAAGHRVTAVDRDVAALKAMEDSQLEQLEVIATDLEDGSPWPLGERRFDLIVVTNYLHRPLLDPLLGALAAGGTLIYETFAQGNERFGKPSNPAFLLRPGELLDWVRPRLRVLAYEDLQVEQPKPAMIQRVAARSDS